MLKTKVAIYVRLSQEDKFKINKNDDSESIKNQISMLSAKCEENDWCVYDTYIDDDFSGSDSARPAFNRMINDASEKKFNIILCKTQSRFARDIEVVEKYINHLLPLWGVRFISVVDNADSMNKNNRKSRQINALIDQWYLEDLSENIRQTLAVKRKQGQFVGAFAPYGYLKDPNDKHHLIIDEEAAKIVKYVFKLFLEGYGVSAITRRLNDEKILNPASYKKNKQLPFQKYKRNDYSKIWHTFTVRDILKNQVYLGHLVQHKAENISYKSTKKRQIPKSEWDIVLNTHEPIIDEIEFEKVQEIFNSRTKSSSYKNSGKRSLFSYKLRCLNCGCSMRLWISKQKVYYRCSLKYVSPDSCVGSCISDKVLKEKMLEEINKLYSLYVDDKYIIENIKVENNNFEQDLLETSLSKNKEELMKYEKRMEQLYFDKIDKVITVDEFMSFSEDCRNNINRVKSIITNLENEINILTKKADEKKDIKKLVEKYKNIEVLDRETIDELIEYIEVGGSKNNRIINIHWKF